MFTKDPILTDSGKILFIRALGGERVTFTRFKAGSGTVPSGTTEESLTDLVTTKLAFGISDVDATHPGYLKVNGNFSSNDVSSDFRWRELGLFAKGEDNTEVLYCYINDGSNAGMIKKNSSSVLSEHDVSIVIAVGEAETFTAVLVSGSLYAMREHVHSAADVTSGILPVARGGTGKGTLQAAANDLINGLTAGTNTPTDDDNIILQYSGGGTTTTTYHRKPLSKLWTYIKGKADSVYAALSHTHALGDVSGISLNTTATNIKMDGTQSAGSGTAVAKANHVHPTDTSRAAAEHNHSTSDITSGILPVERGGTGQSTLGNTGNSVLGALGSSTANISDNDDCIIGTGSNPHTYSRKAASKIWTYIKGKADSVYAALSHTHALGDVSGISLNSTATNIKMDGTQSAGSGTAVALANHVHPTDTSRAAASHTHALGDVTGISLNTSADNIQMDGTKSAGSGTAAAKANHVHPTDTSRAAAEHNHAASDITSGNLPIARGGTGAGTMLNALTALGLAKSAGTFQLNYALYNGGSIPSSFPSGETRPMFLDWLFDYLEDLINDVSGDLDSLSSGLSAYNYSDNQAAANLFTLASGVSIHNGTNVFMTTLGHVIIDAEFDLSTPPEAHAFVPLFTLKTGFRPYRGIVDSNSTPGFSISTAGVCTAAIGETSVSRIHVRTEFIGG